MKNSSKLTEVNKAIDTVAELLQTLSPETLAILVQGKINIETLSANELSKRGLNGKGEWVGFKS